MTTKEAMADMSGDGRGGGFLRWMRWIGAQMSYAVTITMLAELAAWDSNDIVMRRYLGTPDADDPVD